MSEQNKPSKAVEPQSTESPMAVLSVMAEAVPEGGQGGLDSMLAAILGAKEVGQLGDAFESSSSKNLVGHTVRIDYIERMPSEYTDGLSIFLVVHGVNLSDDDPITFTTGSAVIVAQLIKCHHEKWFPVDARIEQAPKPTKDGYYPLRLRILGVSF